MWAALTPKKKAAPAPTTPPSPGSSSSTADSTKPAKTGSKQSPFFTSTVNSDMKLHTVSEDQDNKTTGSNKSDNSSTPPVPEEFGVVPSQLTPLGTPPQALISAHKHTENLTIRVADETRIVHTITHAASNSSSSTSSTTTGSSIASSWGHLFSVKVDLTLTPSQTLCIGVKDLNYNLLCVSMLKRVQGEKGPGELAGIKLGDIIIGVNFVAMRNGSQSLLEILRAEGELQRKVVHLQCWRSVQLCSAPPPGATFRRADHVFLVCFSKLRSGLLSEWERWNMMEILLRHMLEEMKLRAALDTYTQSLKHAQLMMAASASPELDAQTQGAQAQAQQQQQAHKSTLQQLRYKQEEMIDIDTNTLHAKAVRPTLNIRIVNTRTHTHTHSHSSSSGTSSTPDSHAKDNVANNTLEYIIRVEDIELGLVWLTYKRYSDFYSLHKELDSLTDLLTTPSSAHSSSSSTASGSNAPAGSGAPTGGTTTNNPQQGYALPVFPAKRLHLHIRYDKLIDQRVVALELYLRNCVSLLLGHVHTDPNAARALRRIQTFLGVDKHIDCIHPPRVDDRCLLERVCYVALNDHTRTHEVAQQVSNFLANVELESYIEPNTTNGYTGMLSLLSQAMNEMCTNMHTQYFAQLYAILSARKQIVPDAPEGDDAPGGQMMTPTQTPAIDMSDVRTPGSQSSQSQQSQQAKAEDDNTITEEQAKTFVARCIRRQVELAMFLPLRRDVLKLMFPFVALHALNLQKSLNLLQSAAPQFFNVDPLVLNLKSLKTAIKSFKGVVSAYIPSDGGIMLLQTATKVMNCFSEIQFIKKELKMKESSLAAPSSTSKHLPGTPKTPPNTPMVTSDVNGNGNANGGGGTTRTISFASTSSSTSSGTSGTSTVAPPSGNFGAVSVNQEDDFAAESTELINSVVSWQRVHKTASTVGTTAPASAGPASTTETPEKEGNQTDAAQTTAVAAASGARGRSNSYLNRFAAVRIPHNMLTSLLSSAGGDNPDSSRRQRSDSETELSYTQHSQSNSNNNNNAEFNSKSFDPLAGDDDTVATNTDTACQTTDNNTHTDISAFDAASMNDDNENDGADQQQSHSQHQQQLQEEMQSPIKPIAVSADDFLPLFTFVMEDTDCLKSVQNSIMIVSAEQVKANMPQLLLAKELMVHLVADEESFGEAGYYLVTFDAAVHHITELANAFMDQQTKEDALREAENDNRKKK